MEKIPKIQIHEMNTDSSREIKSRLKNYEILKLNEEEQEVLNIGVGILNTYREKYGNKHSIPKETVKLQMIKGERDLSGINGEPSECNNQTAGFIGENGEIYIGGDWRNDGFIETAHIIIHEMTHYFTGQSTMNNILHGDDMEAATEMVAIEVLSEVFDELYNGEISWKSDNGQSGTITGKVAIHEFLQENFQTYQNEIEMLHLEKINNEFNYEEVKNDLFSGKDYVIW